MYRLFSGGYEGEAKFKLRFRSGGAIDFGSAMLKAAQMASRNYVADQPPPYSPPTSQWYAAPPPAYAANPSGYQGWVPPTNVFPDVPQQGTVYMTDLPPPCEYFLTAHCSKIVDFLGVKNS